MAAHSGGVAASATTTTSDGPANDDGTPTRPWPATSRLACATRAEPGPDDDVDGADRLGAVGQGADGGGTADAVHLVGPGQRGRGQDALGHPPVGTGRAHQHDLGNARHLGRHERHQGGRHQRGQGVGHVAAGAVDRVGRARGSRRPRCGGRPRRPAGRRGRRRCCRAPPRARRAGRRGRRRARPAPRRRAPAGRRARRRRTARRTGGPRRHRRPAPRPAPPAPRRWAARSGRRGAAGVDAGRRSRFHAGRVGGARPTTVLARRGAPAAGSVPGCRSSRVERSHGERQGRAVRAGDQPRRPGGAGHRGRRPPQGHPAPDVADGLYEVERSLLSASRKLDRVLRSMR